MPLENIVPRVPRVPPRPKQPSPGLESARYTSHSVASRSVERPRDAWRTNVTATPDLRPRTGPDARGGSHGGGGGRTPPRRPDRSWFHDLRSHDESVGWCRGSGAVESLDRRPRPFA